MKPIVPILLAATACGAPATHATKLQAPLDSLAFYVGHWSCKGTYFTPKEEHWDATIDVAPELGGTWLSVEMTGPGTNHTAEHKGYEAATKTWHHVAVVNDGSWGAMSSPGWDGSKMVFAPDGTDDHTRATFTKLGERKYSHAVSKDGEKVWEKVCEKQS
jgi:hypothetical protein